MRDVRVPIFSARAASKKRHFRAKSRDLITDAPKTIFPVRSVYRTYSICNTTLNIILDGSFQEVRHKNIVPFYGTRENKHVFLDTVTSTQLFMKACHGDLGRITETNRILSLEELKYVSRNILEPLKYLHTAEVLKEAQKEVIIHR